MTEVIGLSAARAASILSDSRQLRDQQLQRRQQLDLQHQTEVNRRNQAIQEQHALSQRRILDSRGDLRAGLDFEAERNQDHDSRVRQLADDTTDTFRQDTDNALRAAGERDFLAGQPRLRPLTPVIEFSDPDDSELGAPLVPRGPVNTPLSIEDRQELLGLNNFDAPDGGFASTTAPVGSFAEIDGTFFEPDEGPSLSDQDAFQVFERERNQRLADRRDFEQTEQSRQEPALRQADERLATVQPNPGLPRGSIVDVIG